MRIIRTSDAGLTDAELLAALKETVSERTLRRVLLLPPDYTRLYSGAGKLTAMYYRMLSPSCEVDVMPALGTHEPMSRAEAEAFFEGAVPYERVLRHDWRHDVVRLGAVPAAFVAEASEGLVRTGVDVEVNRRIVNGGYDLILSIGQVVPHEVVGMANHAKNIFVGCGGSSMINSSHMLGAFYGMERVMGRDFSPVRRIFDYAEASFLSEVPLLYVLTVTTHSDSGVHIHGLYCGRERSLFELAVADSQRRNFTYVEKPLQKVVVYLDEGEFKSTWLGNKAIYRTRMAIADGGELLVLAPGVKRFGEDAENDRLIRKYGYAGRETILRLTEENDDLQRNLSAAAHLIHGSSDGRFRITYAPAHLTREETEGVQYSFLPYAEAAARYHPERLTEGFHTMPDGEIIYYIQNPALGLWSVQERE